MKVKREILNQKKKKKDGCSEEEDDPIHNSFWEKKLIYTFAVAAYQAKMFERLH